VDKRVDGRQNCVISWQRVPYLSASEASPRGAISSVFYRYLCSEVLKLKSFLPTLVSLPSLSSPKWPIKCRVRRRASTHSHSLTLPSLISRIFFVFLVAVFWQLKVKIKVKSHINALDITPTAEALRYSTRCRGISQFYCTLTRLSKNLKNHNWLCLPAEADPNLPTWKGWKAELA